MNKHNPVGEDGEDEVSDRTCRNDGGALPDGFVVKSLMTQLGRHAFDAFVEHFDIAAKWNQRDDIVGAVAVTALPERLAEADRKTLNFHATATSDPEVAKLMNRNQYAQRNDKGDKTPEYAQHLCLSSEGAEHQQQ